ncbi:hydantoinase/oxoprolinase family protein [Agromyces laixinhei]|uniref:hydantoinase/oxoprolinase family protein n=1 Tax=Agromyces laixinhei TaxID=2585717 RepID=UPI0012EE910C|nr:hydantoinase/oxoprolinase family protein [Agromyces laixinhei]
MRIGIECGGTFTDIVVVDDFGRITATNKVFSTPDHPSRAVIEGIDGLPAGLADGAALLHGSTVATNALLERDGEPIGLITTKGFRDLVFLQRQDRTRMYDLGYTKPQPLVERRNIVEVDERVAADGTVQRGLDEMDVAAAIARLAESGVAAIAVCLLHAYANPEHERRVARAVADAGLDVPVSTSHEVVREFREFERATTTVVDAFIRPRVGSYLSNLRASIGERNIASMAVMQSNGGIVPPEAAIARPVTMLLSGPAAGVSGAVTIAAAAGVDRIITMDMGGTSTDVSFVQGGEPELATGTVVDGLPLRVPLVDIHTVGAGGGSIIHIDAGGLLSVGPQSAGAMPGPACYGRGGTRPTITDANLLVGAMPEGARLAGRFELDHEAARRSFEPLAEALGRSVEQIAADAIQLANVTMAGAIREVSLERGHELDGAALIAYGGAGALHAASVAEELGVDRVLIPPHAGLTSAYGLLTASFKRDFSSTWFQPDLVQVGSEQLAETCAAMAQAARREIAESGVITDHLVESWIADIRYLGQGFELSVPFAPGDDAGTLLAGFHVAHQRQFGHSSENRIAQLVTLRLRLVGPKPPVARVEVPPTDVAPGSTTIVIAGERRTAPVYERGGIYDDIIGPAVVADHTSTTLVPVGWTASLDANGNIVLERRNS